MDQSGSDTIAKHASKVADVASAAELRCRPPIDVAQALLRLDKYGPATLSFRERRVLLSFPPKINAGQLRKLLAAYPSLTNYVAKVCLTHWPSYVSEQWGEFYEESVFSFLSHCTLPVFERSGIPPQRLLARKTPTGDATLSASYTSACILSVYEHLSMKLGFRDTWLFLPSVLVEFLRNRLVAGQNLDDAARKLLGHDRLRALLLPAAKMAAAGPPVRTSTTVQAKTIATFLEAKFANHPRLSHNVYSDMLQYLLESSFGDPRSSLRSEGWEKARLFSEHAFRRMLSSLCEQDLEIFFNHAMNMPDRRTFWLRYLSEIESTGCVLNEKILKQL